MCDIEVELQVIREVVAEAQIPGDRLYRPGRHAFLSREQFDRYDETVDQLFARLRRVVKGTHRIGRDLSSMAEDDVGALDDARAHFERILNDRNQTIDTVVRDLTAGIRSLKGGPSRDVLRGPETRREIGTIRVGCRPTTRFSSPGLGLLAPPGDRVRWADR